VSEQRTTLSKICPLLLADYIIAITTTATVATASPTTPAAALLQQLQSPFTTASFDPISPGAGVGQQSNQQQQQVIGLPSTVEAALEPGAFALMDVCAPHDLQFLHMALGSGCVRTARHGLKFLCMALGSRQYPPSFPPLLPPSPPLHPSIISCLTCTSHRVFSSLAVFPFFLAP
ncbi:unnamed protein product, partial [Closterium sp. Naga37s-1]